MPVKRLLAFVHFQSMNTSKRLILVFTRRQGSALIQLEISVQNDVMDLIPVIDKVHKLKLVNKVRLMSRPHIHLHTIK